MATIIYNFKTGLTMRCLLLGLAAAFCFGCRMLPETADSSPDVIWRYCLRDDASLTRTNFTWYLSRPDASLAVSADGGPSARLLQDLSVRWSRLVPDTKSTAALDEFKSDSFARHLSEGHWLQARIYNRNQPFCTITPAPLHEINTNASVSTGVVYRLSRFAYLHRGEKGLILESPVTSRRCYFYSDPALALLWQLSIGFSMESYRHDPAWKALGPAAEVLLEFMAREGFVVPEKGDKENEPGSPKAFWEFHDLLFHAHSFNGRDIDPSGGTYRFKGAVPPLPPVKPPMGTNTIILPKPSEADKAKLNTPFHAVLAARQSIRTNSGTAMTLDDLGAFLYSAARVKRVETIDSRDGDAVSYRPYPSGGARHPLEIYLFLRNCAGVLPGMYHYDPQRHILEPVELKGPRRVELERWNPLGAWGGPPQQALIFITARFGRTAWKYERIAYRLVQEDLGCLYQTFYLVATALKLAPCAIGNADPDLFAAVTSIDYYAEPLVGVFALGR